MKRRKYYKSGMLIILIGFLITCTFAYYVDTQRNTTLPVYELRPLHSQEQDEFEASQSGVYPITTYDITVSEFKGANRFESKVKLSNLDFERPKGNTVEVPDPVLYDIFLRFYFASPSQKQSESRVDAEVSITDGKPIKLDDIDSAYVEHISPRDFVWTASESSASLYPFDSYVLSLNTEEEAEYTGVIGTNSAPEKLRVMVINPRLVSSFTVNNGIGFVHLRRPWLLRMLAIFLYAVLIAFVYYLFTLKSLKQFLPSALGYVAGIWGIRSIISTDAPTFPTITDYASLILLGVVEWIVAWKLIFSKEEETLKANSEED